MMFDRYACDDITASRHKGAETSEEAFEVVRPLRIRMQRRILDHLRRCGDFGSTTEEVAVALGMPYTTVSARLSELKRDGRIRATGNHRATSTGCAAKVVVAT